MSAATMPALIAAPASVEALEGMSVKDMRALCTQLAIEYPSRATRLVLTELLAATLFPGDPGPADPPDAASIAGMAKAELQAQIDAQQATLTDLMENFAVRTLIGPSAALKPGSIER